MNDERKLLAGARRTLRFAGITSIVLASLLYLATEFAVGWSVLMIMDRYGECYQSAAGVISAEGLEEFHGGAYGGDEFVLLFDFLLDGVVASIMLPVKAAAIILLGIGIFLIWRSTRIPKAKAETAFP